MKCEPTGGDTLQLSQRLVICVHEHCKLSWGVMHTSCDTQASVEVVDYTEQSRPAVQWVVICGHESNYRHPKYEKGVQPVDMAVPISPGDGCFCDVNSLEVILFRPEWLVVFRSVVKCVTLRIGLVHLRCHVPAGYHRIHLRGRLQRFQCAPYSHLENLGLDTSGKSK